MRYSSKLAILALSALATAAPTVHQPEENIIQPGLVERTPSLFDTRTTLHTTPSSKFAAAKDLPIASPDSSSIARIQFPSIRDGQAARALTISPSDRSLEDTPNKPRASDKTLLNSFLDSEDPFYSQDADTGTEDAAAFASTAAAEETIMEKRKRSERTNRHRKFENPALKEVNF